MQRSQRRCIVRARSQACQSNHLTRCGAGQARQAVALPCCHRARLLSAQAGPGGPWGNAVAATRAWQTAAPACVFSFAAAPAAPSKPIAMLAEYLSSLMVLETQCVPSAAAITVAAEPAKRLATCSCCTHACQSKWRTVLDRSLCCCSCSSWLRAPAAALLCECTRAVKSCCEHGNMMLRPGACCSAASMLLRTMVAVQTSCTDGQDLTESAAHECTVSESLQHMILTIW